MKVLKLALGEGFGFKLMKNFGLVESEEWMNRMNFERFKYYGWSSTAGAAKLTHEALFLDERQWSVQDTAEKEREMLLAGYFRTDITVGLCRSYTQASEKAVHRVLATALCQFCLCSGWQRNREVIEFLEAQLETPLGNSKQRAEGVWTPVRGWYWSVDKERRISSNTHHIEIKENQHYMSINFQVVYM